VAHRHRLTPPPRPPPCRGLWLTSTGWFWTAGTVLEAGLAWALLNSAGWRVLVAVSAAPLALLLCVLGPLMPESPRWLLAKGAGWGGAGGGGQQRPPPGSWPEFLR
jgi:hypothetical protein